MKRLVPLLLILAPFAYAGEPQSFRDRFRQTIERYLGLPYVWGASGIRSFDCSGFVWRVHYESGILMKRTTARKLYFSVPPIAEKEKVRFGDLIFFNDLQHVGIVKDDNTFYHAHRHGGTTLSRLDPYWRPLITGVRRVKTL